MSFKHKLLLIVIPLTFITITLVSNYLKIPGPLAEDKILIIKPNLSTHKISRKLAQENIIKYPEIFEIIARIYSYNHPLKSGQYKFSKGDNPYEILEILTKGKSIIHKFVFPEGIQVNEIITKINDAGILTGTIDNEIEEGSLMPSTYFYSYGDKQQTLINKMRTNMDKTLSKVMLSLPDNYPLKTKSDILTLASIIEKEAANDEEKPKIAAVFINRLKKGMKLQADPTVIYAITKGKYQLERKLTRKDLKIESPYNTYHIYGLPAAPIACPGEKSLKAAVNPASTKDLYFVVNGNGGHNFAKSLKEHNNNVRKFRKTIRSKKLQAK